MVRTLESGIWSHLYSETPLERMHDGLLCLSDNVPLYIALFLTVYTALIT